MDCLANLVGLIYIGTIYVSCNASNTGVNNPPIINSLGMQTVYNELKWNLYCILCDEKLEFSDSTVKDAVTFGELELRFDAIDTLGERLSADTMNILFYFYYKGNRCDMTYMRNLSYFGAYVVTESKKILCYSTRRDFTCIRDSCIDISQCRSRLVNPIQPEVIEYINKNKTKLAPWFYDEAKRRKVLK